MAEIFRIKIEKWVAGGDCLGHLPDGRAVFIPFVIPGEEVDAVLVEEKKRFARGWPVAWHVISPERITARCLHFGECGGCQYQHIRYAQQLQVKEEIVADQLRRIAKIENPPLKPIVPSPEPWYYRNTIQFQLSSDGKLGFIHVDGEHLLPISECHLPQAGIGALWPQLDLGEDSGINRLGIREDTSGDLMVIMEGDDPKPPEFEVDIPISALYTPPDARLTVLAGEDHLIITIKDRPFRVSARSFFQVNTLMAEKLIDHLLENLDFSGNLTVLELYAGVGLFSAFIAPRVAQLIAVESAGSSCYDFSVNLDTYDNVVLYEADAEEVIPTLAEEIDMLIVDPPRAGLALAVHDALEKLQPKQIAYISCDPATLARDLKKILTKGYELISVTPFDLFPQTAHVETIVLMSKV